MLHEFFIFLQKYVSKIQTHGTWTYGYGYISTIYVLPQRVYSVLPYLALAIALHTLIEITSYLPEMASVP